MLKRPGLQQALGEGEKEQGRGVLGSEAGRVREAVRISLKTDRRGGQGQGHVCQTPMEQEGEKTAQKSRIDPSLWTEWVLSCKHHSLQRLGQDH